MTAIRCRLCGAEHEVKTWKGGTYSVCPWAAAYGFELWMAAVHPESTRTCSRAPNPHAKCCPECPNPGV